MSINPLNHHYAMENPPSVYDEEAMTALELAGRTAAKVNECVEVCNQIPDTVANTVQEHIAGGSFDKQIDKSLGDLEATVTAEMEETRQATAKTMSDTQANLHSQYTALEGRVTNLATLREGSTTGDAELVDGRTGDDGTIYQNIGDAIREQAGERMRMYPTIIFSNTYATHLPDANGARDNTIYNIQCAGNLPANLPGNYPTDGAMHQLYNYGPISFSMGGVTYVQRYQYIFDQNGKVKWFRTQEQGTWDANWTEIGEGYYPTIIFSSTYAEHLPDANNAITGMIYNIQCAGNLPANLPADFPTNGEMYWLETTGWQRIRDPYNIKQKYQYLYDKGMNAKWLRCYEVHPQATGWGKWEKVKNTNIDGQYEFIRVGPGFDFEKLIDALEYAYSTGNVRLFVTPGTYDIVAEYGDSITSAGTGPKIGNNTYLYFQPGAKVVCHYTGGNADVERNFAPINAGDGNFTIENMVIDCSKVRYCVHDELGGKDVRSKHIYKHCDMKLNNVGSSWTSPQCIGGGMGRHTDIEIVDCVFESAVTGHDDYHDIVSYHNGYDAGCHGTILVKDCYFKGVGGVRFGYYGLSTAVTPCIVSGCSLGRAPLLAPENSTATIVNMSLTAWNNDIR